MGLQEKARFKMIKANILVNFVKKVFVDLHLDYPGNLEEIKDTKKNQKHTGGFITKSATAGSFLQRGGEKTRTAVL